jgi:ferredoxin-NADP reductase
MEYSVKVISVDKVNDVLRIMTERPANYFFVPGQATEVAIDKPVWRKEKRPFTFTCLPDDDFLEFTIKTYPSHKGVTNELLQLRAKDLLIIHDVFGEIAYSGEGIFIAGGAGVTPFIAIFRSLADKEQVGGNRLIFANKTSNDIILFDEFHNLLGDNFINILSEEKTSEYFYGRITEQFLKAYLPRKDGKIYLCGPEPMMEMIELELNNLGIDKELVIKEKF